MKYGNVESSRLNSKFNDQTIDGGVSANDCVYLKDGTWYKATSSTPVPIGVYEGSNIVCHKGVANVTGLTSNSVYYMQSTGALGTTATKAKIGIALSSTLLEVNIEEVDV